jgi:hypothetical protein
MERAYIILTDSLGNEKFTRYYDHFTDTTDQNYFYNISPTADHGFVSAAFCIGGNTPQYCWVVKVDSVGCLVPFCDVGIAETLLVASPMIIYPNPANTEVNLKIEMPVDKDGVVKVFSSTGSEVLRQQVSSGESLIRLNVTHLPAGLYFINFLHYSGKFVKQN